MRSSSNPLMIFLCVILPLFILTCEPDEPVAPQPEPEPEPELFEVTELVGKVQKGPYLNGSELALVYGTHYR